MHLTSLLNELGITYVLGGEHRHVRDGWVGVDCPWCGSHDKYHLGIPDGGGVAICWICGRHSLAELIHEIARTNWTESHRLAARATVRVHHRKQSAPRERVRMPFKPEPLARIHKRYLRGRGFDPDIISELWGTQSTGPVGRYAWRLWIPVHQDGQLVSWTTRAVVDRGLRYVHADPDMERMPIKSLLYGEDYVPGSIVIVCEGPTDAWRLGPGAVATFGTTWTEEQARRLERFPVRAICFDRQRRAQRSAWQLYRRLHGIGETYVVVLDADDPGSADPAEVLALRQALTA